jgi:hypothetical protein
MPGWTRPAAGKRPESTLSSCPAHLREARLRADVPGIHVLLDAERKEDVDGRAFAAPKGFGPAGGSSPAMTTGGAARDHLRHQS